MDYAIETENLTKRYSKKIEAVKNLNLKVLFSSVYIFIGRNGAGKTTSIRMMMGLLKRTSGNLKILGFDPEKNPVELRKKVGYVAEEQKMYDWMSVKEIINFCKPFYPQWDEELEKKLIDIFELKYEQKLKHLSRGAYKKVALLLALCHKPEIIILDDPFRGLDPVSRKEFLEGVIFLLKEERKTIFFSTHIIGEVEEIGDTAGIIEKGKLLLSERIEELKKKFKKIEVEFKSNISEVDLPEIVKTEKEKKKLTIFVKNFNNTFINKLRSYEIEKINIFDLSLEQVFMLLAGNR